MEIQEKQTYIAPIIEATGRELERMGEQHSCIFAGSVLIDVLKAYGFLGAYPLPVNAIVVNPAFAERLRTRPFPADAATQGQWADEGCSMVSIGAGNVQSTRESWAAHLVVVIPGFYGDRHAICDLTITQAHKPEWGIHLMPVFVRVPDSFVKGYTEFKAPMNGSLILYNATPADVSFQTAPVWRDRSYRDNAVEIVLSRLASDGVAASVAIGSHQELNPWRSGKTQRNEPCPCGSGKKYKLCHGR